jgi:hypothetical protein
MFARGDGRDFSCYQGAHSGQPRDFPAKPFKVPLIVNIEPLLAHESEYERESS